jgi:sodium-coupled monocarboxylate transporter 8/12
MTEDARPGVIASGRRAVVSLRPLDLLCFAFYMVLLTGTGLYFTRRQKGLKSYLFADQDVHWVIVAVSVLAALFSGITYLGAPAEAYYHDLGYLWVVASFLIATPITTLVFLPFFRGLNLSTAYEYLERRFDGRVRRTASVLFLVRVSLHLAMVIYAPSLAVVEITGWPLWAAVLVTGGVATLYTTLGGMKAVIWTDSLQFLVLCGGIVLILGFAVAEVPGGLSAAWQNASAAGRTRMLNMSLDPTVRVTFWGALIGGTCHNLVQMVTDQISVQRYLTAKSLEECQRALWLKLGLTLPLVTLFYLTGTVLFGYYRAHPEREPVLDRAGRVVARAEGKPSEVVAPLDGAHQNRVLPFFVVRQLPSPLPGVLIAAVFGATIAAVSAGINALATAALMDFTGRGSETTRFMWARVLTLLFGFLATILALEIRRLGTLVEASVKIFGVFGGPLLGIFFLGVFLRRANGSGALIGGFLGALTGLLVAFSDRLFGRGLSMMWIPVASTAVTFGVGGLASLGFAPPGPDTSALVYRRRGQHAPRGEVATVHTLNSLARTGDPRHHVTSAST